jgi:hypothetical protein
VPPPYRRIIHDFEMFFCDVHGEGGVDIQGFDFCVIEELDAIDGISFTGSGVPSEDVLV